MLYRKEKQDTFIHIFLIFPTVLAGIPVVIWDILSHLLGLPIDRSYIKLDRHKLHYLSFMEKLNCLYCGYANGLIAAIVNRLSQDNKDDFTIIKKLLPVSIIMSWIFMVYEYSIQISKIPKLKKDLRPKLKDPGQYWTYTKTLWKYIELVAARTESYWCAIRHHNHKDKEPAHHKYLNFIDYGNQADFEKTYPR